MNNENDFEEVFTDDILSGFLERSKKLQEITNFRMVLAAKIARAMRAKGWNQTQFAKEIDKHNSIISKWLSGTHNFETDTLFEIQKLLGISLVNLDDSSALITSVETKTAITQNVFLLREDQLYSTYPSDNADYDSFSVLATQTIKSCKLNSN